jgi:hypothetical protein
MQAILYQTWRRILSRGSQWESWAPVPHYLTEDQQREWQALQRQFDPILSVEPDCGGHEHEHQPAVDPTVFEFAKPLSPESRASANQFWS